MRRISSALEWRAAVPRFAILALAAGLATHAAAASPPPAASPRTCVRSAGGVAGFVTEASRRYGLPEAWIRAVMRAESAGNPCAVSSAGAMGLMQIMPGTWAELRARHRLGGDPFDPRDNILAGAAYLRELHDRYGPVGMLAAYNAGPGRYEDHQRRGRPLPRETVAYLATLAPHVGVGSGSAAAPATPDPFAWRHADLFAGRASPPNDDGPVTVDRPEPREAADVPSSPLFIPLSGRLPQ